MCYERAMSCSIDDILNSRGTGRTVLMGVLNVTPDSFSDGGKFLDPAAAIAQAEAMVSDGADIIDVGAESTQPGSDRVSADEQIQRLREILQAITQLDAHVSIDATSAKVAEFALDAGASIINDISAGRDDPEMFALAARRGTPLVLMHMLGEPKTMQESPEYEDVVPEVKAFLAKRIAAAVDAGVSRDRIIVDPGIGFGKLLEHNLALLGGVPELLDLSRPVLIGPSRKRFIGEIAGRSEPTDRIFGTIAACLAAWRGGATIFRVHDVGAVSDALAVAEAIAQAGKHVETA